MKILIVSQYFYPERFRINDIAQGLIEQGHEVSVLTGLPNYPEGSFFKGYSFFGPYQENHQGINIIRVPIIPRGKKKGLQLALNYLSFFITSTILAPFFLKERYDKIFVYQLSPVTAAFPAVVMKWLKNIPIVFWVTDLWPETLEATGIVKRKWILDLWGKFVKFLYDQSDVILVTSKGFTDKIAARGVHPGKIRYWPQWGEEIFAKNIIQEDAVGEGEIPEGFKVMFAGNIGTSQGFETIVAAAEKLKDHQDIKWVILGDGLRRPWIEEQIKKRGLEKCFFLLGSRALEAMPAYYQKSDVLLASLKKDPLFAITVPAKVQSYLPSGKPLIVSMDGEGAELLNDAQAGISCAADSVDELAEAVLSLYRMSQEEREILGARAREYFFKNFEREKLLNQLIEIFVQTDAGQKQESF